VRIAFFCYPAEQGWLPDAVERGVGGSEEAVIHVAAGLAARGHEVFVANCGARANVTINGVVWTSFATLDRKTPFDIAIVWRRPGLVRWIPRELSVGRVYLWMHDAIETEIVMRHEASYHKLFVLSRFHRCLYPALSSDRFLVTSNGIEPLDFAGSSLRDPHLMVYGSAYERGLRMLLESWRTIRKAVPDARLNIFYGWQSLQRFRPEHCAKLRPYFERLMRQPGITHLGRIGHADVARQYRQGGVWAYPCSFPETSCISAMKAQAGGAVPVVIPTGALRETVQFGYKTMRSYTDYRGMPVSRRVLDEWREALIALLRAPEHQERIRREMRPASLRRFSWSRVVSQWLDEFGDVKRAAA
jgi:glycosyltransferase involved in cell wall biosynthesis